MRNKWAALIGAVTLIIGAAACSGAGADTCPSGVTQAQVDIANKAAADKAGTPDSAAAKDTASHLASCLAQQAKTAGTSTSSTKPPSASTVEDLKALCSKLEDNSSYLPALPGPTPNNSGLGFSSATDVKSVASEITAGIMTDFVSVGEASVHWGEIDRGAILGSTNPHGAYDTAAEAQRLRQDSQARQKACDNLALELANAYGSDTVLQTLTPELAQQQRITQLAFWVYDPEYKTSGWECGQAVPPDGIRLLSWKRSFHEGGSPLGDTVTIAVDRRELVSFDCPGATFTGTQLGPVKAPATTTSSSTTTSTGAAQQGGGKGQGTQGGTPSSSPSGPGSGSGCGGSCGSSGQGGSSGGSTGGSGGSGCTTGCPGTGGPGTTAGGPGTTGGGCDCTTTTGPTTSTTRPTTSTTKPPTTSTTRPPTTTSTTLPPTTVPPTTTPTTVPTTTPTTEPSTTSSTKGPPPPCYPWIPWPQPGSCPP